MEARLFFPQAFIVTVPSFLARKYISSCPFNKWTVSIRAVVFSRMATETGRELCWAELVGNSARGSMPRKLRGPSRNKPEPGSGYRLRSVHARNIVLTLSVCL